MRLLKGVSIPGFCRTAWVSERAKAMWKPKISAFSSKVQELEVLSVVEGQRKVAWQTINEEHLPEYSLKWAKLGLVSVILKRVGNFSGFSHKHTTTESGKTGSVCVILAKDMSTALEFADANNRNDNVQQGILLGFPKCCSEFFEDVWKKGYYDPIWQAAINTEGCDEVSSRVVKVPSHPFSNAILRYAGVRVGFHIPHSFNCQDTIKINQERYDLGHSLWPEVMEYGKALLSMPMSWEAYHGIAVVRHPLFYVITSSVPCADIFEVQSAGDVLSEETAEGNRFPFSAVREFKREVGCSFK